MPDRVIEQSLRVSGLLPSTDYRAKWLTNSLATTDKHGRLILESEVTLSPADVGPPDPPDPPTTKWPNEPPGLTVITADWDMNCPVPPGPPPPDPPFTDDPLPEGYHIIYNHPPGSIWPPGNDPYSGTPYGWVVNDPAEKAMQFVYPPGMRLGIAPGTVYKTVSECWRMYSACWWKVSDPFDYSTNGTKIQFFFTNSAGQALLTMGADGLLWMMPEFTPVDEHYRLRPPNVNATKVTRGVWHLLEWYMDGPRTPDGYGTTKWWLDGVLQGDWSDIRNDRAAPLMMHQFSPTFGGNGDTYVQPPGNAYWFRNCHLSVGT